MEPGRVLVAGGRGDPDRAYVMDVDTGEFTDLPSMPSSKTNGIACGVVPSPNGGTDYVVAGGGDGVEIYNTVLGAWRPGTSLPEAIQYPAYLPYGDSFIVFGGFDSSGTDPIETVYLYNIDRGTWDIIAELRIGREDFGYAYVSEDNLDC